MMKKKLFKVPNSRTSRGYHLVNLSTGKVVKSFNKLSTAKKFYLDSKLPSAILVADVFEKRTVMSKK